MEKILRDKLIGGKFNSVTPVRSKMMGAVKGKGNKSTELKFQLALAREGLSGWKLHEKLIGNPDFYFPAYKLVVFLDGCFWHGCPECGHVPKTNNEYWKTKIQRTIDRDRKNSNILRDQGYMVVRFWEHELNLDVQNCIDSLNNIIDEWLAKLAEYYWLTLLVK